MKGDGWTDEGRKGRMRRNNRGGGGERQRNKVREHQEQASHLASANTLHCHCERELVHSSDSLKRCQGGEGGRARNGEGDRHRGRESGWGREVGRMQQGEGADRGVTPLLQEGWRVKVTTRRRSHRFRLLRILSGTTKLFSRP